MSKIFTRALPNRWPLSGPHRPSLTAAAGQAAAKAEVKVAAKAEVKVAGQAAEARLKTEMAEAIQPGVAPK